MCQRDDRKTVSDGADPEAPFHVGEFGIGLRFGGDRQRLQRHAADRAAARARSGGPRDASGRCRWRQCRRVCSS